MTIPGRIHPATAYAALKNAVRRACEISGALDDVAPQIGLSKAHLSRAYTIGEDTHLTVDRVLDLDTLAGSPLITTALARKLGYRLEHVAAPLPQDTAMGHMVQVHREASEVVQALSEALADGTLTRREQREIAKQAGEAIEALESLRSSMLASALAED